MALWGNKADEADKPKWLTDEQKENTILTEAGWTLIQPNGNHEVLVAAGADFTSITDAANDAPIIASEAVTVIAVETVGSAYSYDVRVTDIDGDSLTLTTTTAPNWLSLGAVTDAGDGEATATLSGTAYADDTFAITGVVDANSEFVIAGVHTLRFAAGEEFEVTAAGGANDGTYTVDSVSDDGTDTTIVTVETVTDSDVSGTIEHGHEGTTPDNDVVLEAGDGTTTTTQSFTVTVTAA